MAFKNNTWFTLNADLLAEIFPRCVLVACDRDPFFVAQSIWLQRAELYGDPTQWWSVRPADFEEICRLEPLEQVAAQAVSIRSGMRDCLKKVAGAHVVTVPYERLISDPRGVIAEVATHARIENTIIADAVQRLPEKLVSTDRLRIDNELASRLRKLIALHEEKRPDD